MTGFSEKVGIQKFDISDGLSNSYAVYVRDRNYLTCGVTHESFDVPRKFAVTKKKSYFALLNVMHVVASEADHIFHAEIGTHCISNGINSIDLIFSIYFRAPNRVYCESCGSRIILLCIIGLFALFALFVPSILAFFLFNV